MRATTPPKRAVPPLYAGKPVWQARAPEVKLINMLEEEQNYNFSPISDSLAEALLQTYERGEQSIVLINRRGYATFASASTAGRPAKCPNCSVTLT